MTEIFYMLEGEVCFRFADETVVAGPGMTVNIPPGVTHEVTSEHGARLITVFSPGGFDKYLEELAALPESQFADEGLSSPSSARRV
jgi:quercetin dioxygenase-like cupin family protein